MSACPKCGGPPHTAGGLNPDTHAYDRTEPCPHACAARVKKGDSDLCLCCSACLRKCEG